MEDETTMTIFGKHGRFLRDYLQMHQEKRNTMLFSWRDGQKEFGQEMHFVKLGTTTVLALSHLWMEKTVTMRSGHR